MSLFITGTDTGVGKTFLSVQLLRLLRERGLRCAALKPICCGDRHDAELLLAASNEGLTIDEINPLWLRTPVAPFAASLVERVEIDPKRLIDGFEEINRRFDFVMVEGVGGWMVPITKNYFVGDLAAAMDLPVLVLAQNRLGCLNHTLLTLQSIDAKGTRAAGIVLNPLANGADIATATNADVLTKIIDLPLLPMLTEDSTELSVDWCCALTLDPG
ncbi:MAG: dethiobiotin synthase [Verrucomicrobiota bacterium]|nr:dethiobiotin synthase [Verrucomicrobiota bacterium]